MGTPSHSSKDKSAPRRFTPDEIERALNSTMAALQLNSAFQAIEVHARDNLKASLMSACRVVLKEGGDVRLRDAYKRMWALEKHMTPERRSINRLSIDTIRHFARMLKIDLPDGNRTLLTRDEPELFLGNQPAILQEIRKFDPSAFQMQLQNDIIHHRYRDADTTPVGIASSVAITREVTASIERIKEALSVMHGTKLDLHKQFLTLVKQQCSEWDAQREGNLFDLDDHLAIARDKLQQWSASVMRAVNPERDAVLQALRAAIADVRQPGRGNHRHHGRAVTTQTETLRHFRNMGEPDDETNTRFNRVTIDRAATLVEELSLGFYERHDTRSYFDTIRQSPRIKAESRATQVVVNRILNEMHAALYPQRTA